MRPARHLYWLLLLAMAGFAPWTGWALDTPSGGDGHLLPEHPPSCCLPSSVNHAAASRRNHLELLAQRVRAYQHAIDAVSDRWLGAAVVPAGLGDCLKGAASVFYAALATGQRFGFGPSWEQKALFRFFPNASRLPAPAGQRFGHLDTFFDDAATAALQMLAEINTAAASHRVIEFAINGDIGAAFVASAGRSLAFLSELPPPDLFFIFASLYLEQPSHDLQQSLASFGAGSFLTSPTSPPPRRVRIGVQLRVTEQRYQSERVAITNIFVEKIREWCPPCPSPATTNTPTPAVERCCTVFVTSDDDRQRADLLAALRADLLPTLTSSHDPAHFRGQLERDQLLGIWFDWWVLRHCDGAIISRSGFGETAVWSSPTVQRAVGLSVEDRHTWVDCLDPQLADRRSGWNYCGRSQPFAGNSDAFAQLQQRALG
jgi:hypothetical protein